ncbi:kinase-like domain-containing protein, partial [Ampelomyces quisqualis]
LSESSDEEEEDNSIDSDVLRADWGPLKAIPEQLFRLTLLEHLPTDCAVNGDGIRVLEKIEGGNNFVRILELHEGPSADRYVIKVPCTGTAARWIDSDAYMLRNDASTMSYIRKHTDIPCPEVLGFDDTLHNTLGAPYIVMRANKGIPSNKIWFDQDEEGDDDTVNASLPDEDRMRIRVNFLRSLAGHMAKLQTLEFDAAGTLNFDHDAENPVVGPTYHWKTFSEMQQLTIDDLSTPASINCIPAFHSSYEYFLTALDQHWPLQEGPSNYINNGRQHIMARILASPPFAESKKAGDNHESFTIRHDDLDFQNILCDENGNVTAIIDWDKCRTAPRCLGFASLPAFLTKDWAPGFNTDDDIHMPWELNEYRNVYARAMLEATGPDGDGKYTIKSALYEAINAGLYGGHSGGSV